jgi:hypothetical protein
MTIGTFIVSRIALHLINQRTYSNIPLINKIIARILKKIGFFAMNPFFLGSNTLKAYNPIRIPNNNLVNPKIRPIFI